MALNTKNDNNLITQQDFELIRNQHVTHKSFCSARSNNLFHAKVNDEKQIPIPSSITSLTNQPIDLAKMNKLHAFIQLGYHTVSVVISKLQPQDMYSLDHLSNGDTQHLIRREFISRTFLPILGTAAEEAAMLKELEEQVSWLSDTFISIEKSEPNLRTEIDLMLRALKIYTRNRSIQT